ncbi:hypothetical protein ILUMI_27144 [Ignelater luminosus]|uniref:CRC domain-containing protein n=1 Tax=Ignelater luminosus TaxID=2038154 RepID=A0A8K0C3B7_IGNLU|nr:hypothetical protein ILUMI_27144 [Ignelater luminosus]
MSQPEEEIATENDQSKNNENYNQAITSVLQSEHLEMIEDIQSGNEEEYDQEVLSVDQRNRNITDVRKSAYDGLQKQAKRMKVISDNAHPKPDIGSTVRIPVPDVDRGRGDARSILAVVLESTEDGFYRLGTKEGVIAKYYSRSEFSVCPANILTIDEVFKENELSLRSVARAQSTGHGQGFKKCSCKTKCDSKRCACRKNHVLCNSKCHNSLTCTNK